MGNSSASTLSGAALSVGYSGRKPIFENLSINLKAGQLVCLMGPNGSGKSTLLRTLANLQNPLGGTLQGVDPKSMAVVLTDRIQAPAMTIRDLVMFGRYPYLDWTISPSTTDSEIVDSAIKELNITDIASRPIDELSDGQVQMGMIARALAQQTGVILMDEPTAHLDLNNRVWVMHLLRSLARDQQKAILVATHELDLALQLADRLWLITPEHQIREGIPEDLVLDGSIDNVFRFKGYDLKTGRVMHASHRPFTIKLSGEGHQFLWTKNAFERNGFKVASDGDVSVSIPHEDKPSWQLDGRYFESLEELIDALVRR